MTTATTSALPPSPDSHPVPSAAGAQPTVPPVPRGAVALARAAVARALLSRAAARLPIQVQAPDGRLSGAGGPGSPVLVIRDEGAFYRRLGAGTAGLAEGYMSGDWDSPDLVGLFTVFAAHVAGLVPAPLWRRQFLADADSVSALGFGPVFQRMWNLYLAYSEAGFRAGYLDVHQLVLERGW